MILKVLWGVVLRHLLFTSSGARQATAGILRLAANAHAPAVEDEDSRTLQNRISEVFKGDQ